MSTGTVDLYWLPLGAGGHSVRFNGRVFEAVAAKLEHRTRSDLYHAALIVTLDGDPFVIEQAPVPDGRGNERGVVLEGPVGTRLARRLRLFRYEVRRWPNGIIADIAEAVESPQRLTADAQIARRLWEAVPGLPQAVWGRAEPVSGEMWNSNSIIAWLLTVAGLPIDRVGPPRNGRAPGWRAGVVAARQGAS